MENTEKIIQNENKDKGVTERIRRNFRPRKRGSRNKNIKEPSVRQEPQTTDKKIAVAPQKPQDKSRTNRTNSVNKPKEVKKPISKDTEILDFVIGEFEENGKKYAFKMVKKVYHIIELVEEQEKEIFKTEDSKTAYFEWCKIKYPEKVKKGMV